MIELMSDEDKLLFAKTLWMAAFETTLNAAREEQLPADVIMTAFFESVTMIVKELYTKEEN